MNNYMNYCGEMSYPQYQDQYNMGAYQYGQRQSVVRVNGENGAKAYKLPPDSSVLLLDNTSPIVWLKRTDDAGYPSLEPYTITPYCPEPPVDVKSLEERIMRLEDIINAKSNNSSTKRNEKAEQ